MQGVLRYGRGDGCQQKVTRNGAGTDHYKSHLSCLTGSNFKLAGVNPEVSEDRMWPVGVDRARAHSDRGFLPSTSTRRSVCSLTNELDCLNSHTLYSRRSSIGLESFTGREHHCGTDWCKVVTEGYVSCGVYNRIKMWINARQVQSTILCLPADSSAISYISPHFPLIQDQDDLSRLEM